MADPGLDKKLAEIVERQMQRWLHNNVGAGVMLNEAVREAADAALEMVACEYIAGGIKAVEALLGAAALRREKTGGKP